MLVSEVADEIESFLGLFFTLEEVFLFAFATADWVSLRVGVFFRFWTLELLLKGKKKNKRMSGENKRVSFKKNKRDCFKETRSQ